MLVLIASFGAQRAIGIHGFTLPGSDAAAPNGPCLRRVLARRTSPILVIAARSAHPAADLATIIGWGPARIGCSPNGLTLALPDLCRDRPRVDFRSLVHRTGWPVFVVRIARRSGGRAVVPLVECRSAACDQARYRERLLTKR